MPHVDRILPGKDTLRLLLTTDNHVGYNELDPIVGDDSWKTFEEIMLLAKDRDVDMVLQSGDLFHVNKPTKKSMYHVMRILRSNCYGEKPIEFELLSDPSLCLDNRGFNYPNYEDPNINVSVPFFAISGNHDDATGDDNLSPLDVLSVSGLMNYFGRVVDNDNINVKPLLFQKGRTKLALYGMSNIRDERMFKTFRDGRVTFSTPGIQTDSWFNLMCVHQNHVQHGARTAYLPENFLPTFLDLVVWGHEHDCIPYPVPNPETGFDTLQPGSSVATSLSNGETLEKNVFILNIKGKDYSLEKIPLKTVRPFVMKDISLTQLGLNPNSRNKKEVLDFMIDEINGLIEEAQKSWLDKQAENSSSVDDSEVDTPLPLVRLRVEYSGGFEVENPRRFSNRFVGKVANVNDIVIFHRKKEHTTGATRTKPNLKNGEEHLELDELNISKLVDTFVDDNQLNLLNKKDVGSVVKAFVEKDDKAALKTFIDEELSKDLKLLMGLSHGEHIEDESISQKKSFNKILKDIKKEKSQALMSKICTDSIKHIPESLPERPAFLRSITGPDRDSEDAQPKLTNRKISPSVTKKRVSKPSIQSIVSSESEILSEELDDFIDDDIDEDMDINSNSESDIDDFIDVPPPKKTRQTRAKAKTAPIAKPRATPKPKTKPKPKPKPKPKTAKPKETGETLGSLIGNLSRR
ncbi:Subunit of the MRX complex with Rad50p and Xrs2p [Komagataella phaffii CBS 7435]|uniref:Double-strand break repair protein n=2 Tax=Komagataella phaffii TaxID=460519 RepID=C4R5R7_KOMPG|nr:Subunit of a complex with Rad50p and Xrs2p (MRX complex) [Komagataella phaffii GS115]AOA63668.1 GQ67_03961T0 [Komagataella phaffii]CAH2449288.1 Subunit of the MRX complex with Rad50p and Xrs2p [Komagataella phaffii CBS 7435]AOA68539.1 GQ68_03935T0 [Komagataella phaffii GS115]CAY70903.1 Subunit of a complex with Rad50p and Xrs2p (MRX complex) [Komagataella phaffii GS115]CCA39301.1 Subunit of the MRX complex with Rad50p and Xrs2p [Komagataella phaffii CBS 7435]